MPLVQEPGQVDFRLEDLRRVAAPDRVLLADPAEFDVRYAINPHMRSAGGELERVDRARAREQWEALRACCEDLGLAVDVLPALAGHPDLVFCANQALPVPRELTPGSAGTFVPSHMATAERTGEVPHVAAHLRTLGLEAAPLDNTGAILEGMGDGVWHPGRALLWAGVGPRSSAAAWDELAARLAIPVVLLELVDPDFYHLDTCLAALSESSCLWFPPAFTARGRELVERLFARRIEADEREARERLACNAWSPDGEHVLMQAGCTRANERLRAAGFEPVELETGEYLKSGGSVFCMKLAHWGPLDATES